MMKQSTSFAQGATNLLNVLQGYTKGIQFVAVLTMLLMLGIGQAWGAEGDVLKTYDTNSSTFASGYSRKTGDNFVWWGQKGYYGANSAANHGNLKPTAADLPVVKAQKSSATTSTTGYYYLYTSEAVANVGKVEVKFTGKSGSSTVNAYVVSSSTEAASGSATWTKVTLASSSSKAQGANVATAGTYTFTFDATETDAKYYGVVFVTSSSWRATNLTFKLYEGAPAVTEPHTVTLKDDNSTHTQSTAGGSVTLPTRKGCAGYTFAGWTSTWTSEQTTWTTIAPTIIPAGPYTPTKNVDLYPVYTKTAGGGTAYEKVTTLTEGVYVMVSEKTSGTYKYMPNTTSSGSNPTLGSGITMNNGKTALTNDITEAMLWDLTATGTANQYYLRPHGSTTIGLGCTASTGANIRISTTYKDVKWTITTSSNYGWQFKSNASTAMYLAVYTDDNWRNYTSPTTNQNGKFYLFKQTSSSTTYYISVPDCTTQTSLCLVQKEVVH